MPAILRGEKLSNVSGDLAGIAHEIGLGVSGSYRLQNYRAKQRLLPCLAVKGKRPAKHPRAGKPQSRKRICMIKTRQKLRDSAGSHPLYSLLLPKKVKKM